MGREIYDIINDMAEVLNASQVEKVHPHKFRRTMATRAINVKLSHRKYIS